MPHVLSIVALSIVVLGWWMTFNAHAIYDADFAAFVRVRSLTNGLPGSIDQAISAAWMLRASALLGTVCIVADAAREPVWLVRFCLTSAAAGGSISLLGLLQKATRAPMIFWREVDQPVGTFFATFYYHGNAGAFLNLTLPLTMGVAYRAFIRRQRPFARAVWLTAAFLNLVAVFANTSRMGHLLGLAILFLLMLAFVRQQRRGLNWRIAAMGAVALVLATFAVMQTTAVERSLHRWNEGTISADARWVSSTAALRALPDAAWVGFGPGTFHVIFPYYTAGVSGRLNGFWRYLHEDYLQTLLEWGVVGGALWAVIFFGGMAVAFRAWLSPRAKTWRPRQRLLLPLILLALTSVALHALVDFPLQIVSIQLYVAVYLGICWSAPQWGRNN